MRGSTWQKQTPPFSPLARLPASSQTTRRSAQALPQAAGLGRPCVQSGAWQSRRLVTSEVTMPFGGAGVSRMPHQTYVQIIVTFMSTHEMTASRR